MKASKKIRCLCFCVLCCFGFRVKGETSDTANTALSCYDCCRPDGHAPIGIMTDHLHEKGKVTVSYSYMNMEMNGNRIGTNKASDDVVFQHYMMSPNTMTMQMHMLMGMVGLTNHLTVMGMLDYNSINMTMTMMPMAEMHMHGMMMNSTDMPTASKTSGMGDSKIYLLYKLMEVCRQRIILGAGLNIPTGSITQNGATMLGDNTRLPYSMQLGTGTWNFLPSITYIGQRNLISWGAEADVDLKPSNNSEGYSFGNQYRATAWFSCKFLDWSSVSVRAEGVRTDKINGYDPSVALLMNNDPSSNTNNYGGQLTNLYFGLNFFKPRQPMRGLRFLAEYGIPVYQNLNGTQMSLQNTFQIGSQYTF